VSRQAAEIAAQVEHDSGERAAELALRLAHRVGSSVSAGARV
jgi:hypothetical protein